MVAELTADERLAALILAAQMAALRDQLSGAGVVERLAGCDALLALLVSQLSPDCAAAATAVQLEKALDDLALSQAQSQDIARQTAELVMRALKTLAAGTLSLGHLNALYVSDPQRRLHEALLAAQSE